MTENEMGLNQTASDLRDEVANHPTNAQLDATVREVMLHIDRTVAQHANAFIEGVRDTIRALRGSESTLRAERVEIA